MLAVLMSMKPEWWEKILAGDKVLEIRKTHPQSKKPRGSGMAVDCAGIC